MAREGQLAKEVYLRTQPGHLPRGGAPRLSLPWGPARLRLPACGPGSGGGSKGAAMGYLKASSQGSSARLLRAVKKLLANQRHAHPTSRVDMRIPINIRIY